MRYECTSCGATGCKLWRRYSSSCVEPVCADCLEEATGEELNEHRLSSLGWYVAAVPDLDGSWWGYASVPPHWVAWWNALPTRPSKGGRHAGA